MSNRNKIVSLILTLVMCINFIPLALGASAVQAQVGGPPTWTKDGTNPFASLGNLSGEPTVICDMSTTPPTYKMWYTQSQGSFTGFNSILSKVLSDPNVTSNFLSELASNNFSHFTSTDNAAAQAMVTDLLGLSATTDIQPALQGAMPVIMYAESTDGITWINKTAATFTESGGTWDSYGRSAPTVIPPSQANPVWQMWYTGFNPDPGVIGQLQTDLRTYEAMLTGPNKTQLVNDLLINKNVQQFFTDLKGFLGTNYTAFQNAMIKDLLARKAVDGVDGLLATMSGKIGRAVSSDGKNWNVDANPGQFTDGVSPSTTWDSYGAYSPTVTPNGSTLEMWYTGLNVDPVALSSIFSGTSPISTVLANSIKVNIGEATSTDDGIHWLRQTADANVFSGVQQAPGVLHGALSPSVVRTSPTNLDMWYNDASLPSSAALNFVTGGPLSGLTSALNSSIYHAASTNNGQTWTVDASPALSPSNGSWDALSIGAPFVMPTSSGYTMWYTGMSSTIGTFVSGILKPAPDTTNIIGSAITNSNTVMQIGRATLANAKITPTLSITNPSVTYNGAPQAASVVASVPGIVSNIQYNGSLTVPTNANSSNSSYVVTADFVPTDTSTYNSLIGASAGYFVINKATPAFSGLSSPTIILGNTPTSLGGNINLGTLAPTGSVSITINSLPPQAAAISGIGSFTASFDTSSLAVGSYTITYAYPGDSNFNSLSDSSKSLTVTSKSVPVFSNLSAPTITVGATPTTLGGTIVASGASGTPVPTGTVAITLNSVTQTATIDGSGNFSSSFATGSLASGNYTINYAYSGDASYSVLTDNSKTLTVSNANATVTLGNLTQTYDGSPKSVAYTTNPAGLTVSVTYNGSATAPTNAGSYTVVASITSPSYTGSNTNTLIISKATPAFSNLSSPSITLGNTPTLISGSLKLGSLAPTGNVSITLNSITQTAAIDASGYFSSSFVTGSLPANVYPLTFSYAGDTNFNAMSDTSKTLTVNALPSVISVSPSNGVSNAPLNTTINVNFSKPMNLATVQNAFSISPAAAGSFSWSGNQMIFTPASNLGYGIQYTVTINSSAQDLVGNSLAANYSWSFTAVSQPVITAVTPATNATGVPINSNLSITFDRAMNQTAVQNAFTFSNAVTGIVLTGTFNWSGNVMTFAPSAILANNQLYAATLGTGAMDLSGNHLGASSTWSFTTITQPSILYVRPPNAAIGVPVNTPISAIFDRAMNQTSVQNAFTLNGAAAGTFSWSGNTLTFTPTAALSLGTLYTVSIGSGAQDLTGDSLAAYTWSFTTISPTLPTVNTVSAAKVSDTSYTLKGNLVSPGTASSVNVSFDYGLTAAYGTNIVADQISLNLPGQFTATLTGLTQGATYHFRAVGNGTTGTDVIFTAGSLPPGVTTSFPNNITGTSVTLNGYLYSLGTPAPSSVSVSFDYGPVGGATTSTAPASVSATGQFSVNVTGLTPSTNYSFRAKVQSNNTSYGAPVPFKTNTVLTSITVSTITPVITVGQTAQFAATGNYSDGSSTDLTNVVIWSSSDQTKATVDVSGQVTSLATTSPSVNITALEPISGKTAGATLTINPVTALIVTPSSAQVSAGATQQFTVAEVQADGSLVDRTGAATWSISDPQATGTTINNTTSKGLATAGTTVGLATITATYGSPAKTGTATLTVTPATLTGISINGGASQSVIAGQTLPLTLTATYSNGTTNPNFISSGTVWASLDTTKASITTDGQVQGLLLTAAGTPVTIRATNNGLTSNIQLTVTATVLKSITVTPNNASIVVNGTQQFIATGTNWDNTTTTITSQVNWQGSDITATGTAINNTTGLATAAGTSGTASITASIVVGGNTITSAPVILSVINASLQSIAVTADPTNPPTIYAGNTAKFVAMGTFNNATVADITAQVTWTSSATNIAAFNQPNTTNGQITTYIQGAPNISASLGTVNSPAFVFNVSAKAPVSVAVTPGTASVAAGLTQAYTATVTYTDATTADKTAAATWNSDATGVASFSYAGSVTGQAKGISIGTANISATYTENGVTQTSPSVPLNVTPKVAQSLSVTPTGASIIVGAKQQFIATETYSDGSTLGGSINNNNLFTWASDSSVDSNGLVTVLHAGQGIIIAFKDGLYDAESFTATPATLTSITLSPVNPTVFTNGTLQFYATGTYSNGDQRDLTSSVAWSSTGLAGTTIANGASSGLAAAGTTTGTATITATLAPAAPATTNLIVTNALVTSITISTNPNPLPIINAGKTAQFVATATYATNPVSTADVTNQVTWSSDNTAVADIFSNGVVQTHQMGNTDLSASLISGGTTITSNTFTINVAGPVLDSLSVTPANANITFISGNPPTQPFVATAKYSDGSFQVVTTQATWTSGTLNTATIGLNTGLATTRLNAGTVTSSITASYTDSFGATQTGSALLTVLPDLVAPTVTLQNPINGLRVSNLSVNVTGNVNDTSATAQVVVNGTPTPLSLDVNGNFNQSVALKNGSNSIYVQAWDPAFNLGQSKTRYVTVVPATPQVNISNLFDTQQINSPLITTPFTIRGTATNTNLVTVVVNMIPNNVTPSSNGTFSFNANLIVGPNYIAAYAYATGQPQTDLYKGTTGVITVTINRRPTVIINSPVAGSYSFPYVTFSGTVDDPTVTQVVAQAGGTPSTADVNNGSFSGYVIAPVGAANLQISATNTNGNTGTSSVPITVTYNFPIVTITSPSNYSITRQTTTQVTGTVYNLDTGVYYLYVNGQSYSSGRFTNGAFNIPSVPLSSANAGVNSLEVRVAPNNIAPVASSSGLSYVTLDNAPPYLQIGLGTPQNSVDITVISNKNLSQLVTTVNGSPVYMQARGYNTWVGTYGSLFQPLVPGFYTVQAYGTDLAGNQGSTYTTFNKMFVNSFWYNPFRPFYPFALEAGNNALSGQAVLRPNTVTQNLNAQVAPAAAAQSSKSYTETTFQTNGVVQNANVSIAQSMVNPSGALSPAGKPLAAAFVEIDASQELRDNLNQVYIKVHYDPALLPAGTDQTSLQLYFWDTSVGSWTLVPGSQSDVVNKIVYGFANHLSQFGVFGAAIQSAPPSSGSGGGGSPPPVNVLSGTGLSSSSSVRIDPSGLVQSGGQMVTPDGKVTLGIATGTRMLNAAGQAVTSLTAAPSTNPPAPPANNALIAAYDFGPSGSTFNPPLTLTMGYTPASLPAGVSENSLTIAYYDGTQWQTLASTVDTVAKTVTASAPHFTSFAILGKIAAAPVVTTTPPVVTTTPPSSTPPSTTPPVSTTVPPVTTTPPPTTTTTQPPVTTPAQTTAPAVVVPTSTIPSPTPVSSGSSTVLIVVIILVVIVIAALVAVITVRRRKSS